jgi:hypothetical protein
MSHREQQGLAPKGAMVPQLIAVRRMSAAPIAAAAFILYENIKGRLEPENCSRNLLDPPHTQPFIQK